MMLRLWWICFAAALAILIGLFAVLWFSVVYAEPTIETFASQAVQYRRLVGGSVTSWGRSVEYNQAIGGCQRSLHLVDLAVDIVPDGELSAEERIQIGRDLGLRVVVEFNHDHIHPLGLRTC